MRFWIDYQTRLLRLGRNSPRVWRLRQDLVYAYKVDFGLVNNAASELFTLVSSTNASINLFPHHNRFDLRKCVISERIIRIIPAEYLQFEAFINGLDVRLSQCILYLLLTYIDILWTFFTIQPEIPKEVASRAP